MAVASLQMDTEEAQRKILRILYRKKKADKDTIEESFRRTVDSAGLSVNKVINSVLKKLEKNGNVKHLKTGYKFVHGRTA